MTRWDVLVAGRTAALVGVAFAAAVLLGAATDEGGVPWLERVARALPALPLAGAAGAWLSMAPLRGRGELRALALAGRSPWQIARPAVLASVAAHALAAALALWVPALAATFFPRPSRPTIAWQNGGFVDAARGVRVLRDGSLAAAGARTEGVPPPLPPLGQLAVACVLVASGGALPAWALATSRRHAPAVLLAGAASAGAAIACFQAAAAGALPAMAAVLPPGALLAGAALRYRRAR